MQPDKRKELEERRRQLQIRRAAEAFLASALQPYVDILDYLSKHDVDFEIIQLMYVKSDWKSHIQTMLQRVPYVDCGFHAGHLEELGLEEQMDQLYDRYPSINSLRYVPCLPKFADYGTAPPEKIRDGLQKAAASLGLSSQKVFLYYLRYTPVIEVSLFDILVHDHEDLFNFWHGDVMIFPSDLTWLMAFTLEEEWYAVKS